MSSIVVSIEVTGRTEELDAIIVNVHPKVPMTRSMTRWHIVYSFRKPKNSDGESIVLCSKAIGITCVFLLRCTLSIFYKASDSSSAKPNGARPLHQRQYPLNSPTATSTTQPATNTFQTKTTWGAHVGPPHQTCGCSH